MRQNLSFVLSNVLGRKLHLASDDVVSILNEGRIEHYPKENLVAESLVDKDNFCVAAHGERFLLLFGQLKNYFSVFLCVLSCCREGKDFGDLHSLTVVNNEARSACRAFYFRHLVKLDPS